LALRARPADRIIWTIFPSSRHRMDLFSFARRNR
jgi:hypothetical protein